jgi:hypothetical protein
MNYCKKQEDQSISGFIEDLVADFLDGKEPEATKITDFAKRKKPKPPEDPTGGGIFSF